MPCEGGHDFKRRSQRVLSHLAKFGIGGCDVIRHFGVVAIHAVQIRSVMPDDLGIRSEVEFNDDCLGNFHRLAIQNGGPELPLRDGLLRRLA